MTYEAYLAAVRAEVARRVGWTLEQATVAVGNVLGPYDRNMLVQEAVDDVLADVFND